MARKPYLHRKKASTSRVKSTFFKIRPSLVEELALKVNRGSISEEQAADIIAIDGRDDFVDYCLKYKISF